MNNSFNFPTTNQYIWPTRRQCVIFRYIYMHFSFVFTATDRELYQHTRLLRTTTQPHKCYGLTHLYITTLP
jgi:hypothetical protein